MCACKYICMYWQMDVRTFPPASPAVGVKSLVEIRPGAAIFRAGSIHPPSHSGPLGLSGSVPIWESHLN